MQVVVPFIVMGALIALFSQGLGVALAFVLFVMGLFLALRLGRAWERHMKWRTNK